MRPSAGKLLQPGAYKAFNRCSEALSASSLPTTGETNKAVFPYKITTKLSSGSNAILSYLFADCLHIIRGRQKKQPTLTLKNRDMKEKHLAHGTECNLMLAYCNRIYLWFHSL